MQEPDCRFSSDGHVVMALIDRAETVDLDPSDWKAAAILVGVA